MGTGKIDKPIAKNEAPATGAGPVRRAHVPASIDQLLTVTGLAVLGLALLGYVLGPWVLWAYYLERAGRLIENGMAWPAPRHVDTLPVEQDSGLLDEALDDLSWAIRWRPGHSQPYRLAGQIYAARQEWERAAEAFDHASRLSPANALPAWEASLIYEGMYQVIETAPATPITRLLADATIEAPDAPIDTPFCRDNRPQSCYVGTTMINQREAGFPNSVGLNARTLFTHPNVQVSRVLYVSPRQPALRFALGLDPAARRWPTDGATFRIWISEGTAPPQQVFERTLDRATALRGWTRGWADLSPWAGATITLTLAVDGGPGRDTTADWFGWAAPTLTTVEAARLSALAPRARMVDAWQRAGLDAAQFQSRADEARAAGRPDEAQQWDARAREMTRP